MMSAPLRCRSTLRVLMLATLSVVAYPALSQIDTTSPTAPVRLVFIHHSTGWAWLNPEEGGLLNALRAHRYYVSDTDYDWGPADPDVNDGASVGSHTDIGHWYNWFLGPNRTAYLGALYSNSALSADWRESESVADPGGENRIIVFKSCFTSAQNLLGEGTDAPLAVGLQNPLRGRGAVEEDGSMYTVANIKGIYRDLLEYFRSKPDKLFVIVTTPPSFEGMADESMPKLRAVNSWLVEHLLTNYTLANVAVFDYSAVLTSNGGNSTTNDLGGSTGSHHRFNSGAVEYRLGPSPYLAYPSWDSGGGVWDCHPTPAGHQKATAEFIPLLNIAYNRWRNASSVPPLAPSTPLRITALYPDPADLETRVTINGALGSATVVLTDALGRLVATEHTAADNFGYAHLFFRTGELASGVYAVSVRDGARCETRVLRVLH